MNPVVLIAHGSPSDPDPQETALRELAAAVGALLPGRVVRGATLAKPGALAAALDGLDAPWIYPFFMAEGWFTRTELPRRLAELGVSARILAPFGVDPALPQLIHDVLSDAATQNGAALSDSPVLLIAHGSKIARKSRNSVYDMADKLRDTADMPPVHVALIEEPPFLGDVAKKVPTGLCLPFFALRAGHVTGDIPEALQEAAYRGRLLPEIGAHREVPRLIAQAIVRSR